MTTMVSFRVSDEEAAALQREAERSQMSTSELLRAGMRAVLARAAAERDAEIYRRHPVASSELIDPADQVWLPDEDWSAWLERDASR